jgi:hypothetical protein
MKGVTSSRNAAMNSAPRSPQVARADEHRDEHEASDQEDDVHLSLLEGSDDYLL